MKKIYIILILFVISLTNYAQNGLLNLNFENFVGNKPVELNTTQYINASKETYNITKLKYFISNISLTRQDGTIITIPQEKSYFLIDQSDSKKLSPSIQVPVGDYNKIEFVLGVDSMRNTMDLSSRTGVLDPATEAAGMYWSWNSGYIFFKMEGTSSFSTAKNNAFAYHIGLFGGYNKSTINNLKNISIDLKEKGEVSIKEKGQSSITLYADVSTIFDGINKISLSVNPVIMVSPLSAKIVENYATMFIHAQTIN